MNSFRSIVGCKHTRIALYHRWYRVCCQLSLWEMGASAAKLISCHITFCLFCGFPSCCWPSRPCAWCDLFPDMPPASSLSSDHSTVQHEAFCNGYPFCSRALGCGFPDSDQQQNGGVRLCFPEWFRGVRVSFRDGSLASVFFGARGLPGLQ